METMPESCWTTPLKVTEHISRTLNGSIREATCIVSDAAGRELERIGYDQRGKMLWRIVRLHWRSKQGNEIVSTTYDARGDLIESNRTRYDPLGRLSETTTFSRDGSVIDRQTYTYDEKAKTMSYCRYNSRGKVVEEWTRADP
jgi:hypothetical protein